MIAMRGRKQNLAGKLLLSSALVIVSVGYAWWHRHNGQGHNEASPHMVAAEAPQPPATRPPARATGSVVMTTRSERAEQSVPAPLAAAQHEARLPAPAPLSALASLRMYQPPPVQTPLPLVTGTP